jgi:tetratricopeptide (TPR) repeat protein
VSGRAQIISQIGDALRRLGRTDEAIKRITAALATLEGDTLDADVAALNASLGRALVNTARYEQAAPALETTVRIRQRIPKQLRRRLREAVLRLVESGGTRTTTPIGSERVDLLVVPVT